MGDIEEMLYEILGRGNSQSSRYIHVESKWKKIGWTIHTDPRYITITTMLLYNTPPYKRNVHVKTFTANDPQLMEKIKSWAMKIRGY